MRTKSLAVSLMGVMIAVAGCGGGSSSASSSKAAPTVAKSRGSVRIYRVPLAGAAETPAGAPKGSGDSVIAFHGSTLVCWRFAHLHGFTNATFAHIHIGGKGRSGRIVVPLSTGPALRHQGCVAVATSLVKAIEHKPLGYYVNIHSAKYPGGAVRGQL
jgi:hypothetical protein